MSRISSSNHAYERVGGSRWVFSLNSRVNIYLQPEPVFLSEQQPDKVCVLSQQQLEHI